MRISVREYAAIRNISRQTVQKQILKGRILPNIRKVSKIGKMYVLEYMESEQAKK